MLSDKAAQCRLIVSKHARSAFDMKGARTREGEGEGGEGEEVCTWKFRQFVVLFINARTN